MCRTASWSVLTMLVLLPITARSEEPPRLADVAALQETVHQAIDRAEPSIACVLVSRSEKYRLYANAQPEAPGRLGRFELPSRRFKRDDDPEFQALARLDLSDPNNVPEAYGSGIVIDERDGLILTMAHVVRKATKIYVRLPGGRGSWADIHAADPRSDLAVLKLIDRVPELKAIKLGDGSKLRKGDFVLSLSNPFAAGFRDGSPSASWGMVSNLRRRATGVLSDVPSYERNSRLPLYCFGTLIQTDARLNLGCSGGALLNLHGELVGLTSALAGIAGGETPGGFAVPLDDGMRRIIAALRRGEEVEYGFLGVYLSTQDRGTEGFVRIDSLVRGGPAARADLHGHILSIDDVPVRNNDELFLVVGMHLAGSTVRVETATTPDGPRKTTRVTLAKFPPLPPVIASKRPAARRGLRVDWSSTLAPHLDRAAGIPEGVAIREVLPDTPAANARLQANMIIKSVNRHKVATPAEFYREMGRVEGPVELTIATLGGEERSVTLDVR